MLTLVTWATGQFLPFTSTSLISLHAAWLTARFRKTHVIVSIRIRIPILFSAASTSSAVRVCCVLASVSAAESHCNRFVYACQHFMSTNFCKSFKPANPAYPAFLHCCILVLISLSGWFRSLHLLRVCLPGAVWQEQAWMNSIFASDCLQKLYNTVNIGRTSR